MASDDGYAVHYTELKLGTPVRSSDGQEVGTVAEVLDNQREAHLRRARDRHAVGRAQVRGRARGGADGRARRDPQHHGRRGGSSWARRPSSGGGGGAGPVPTPPVSRSPQLGKRGRERWPRSRHSVTGGGVATAAETPVGYGQPHGRVLRGRDRGRHRQGDGLPPDQGLRGRLRPDDLRPRVHEHGVRAQLGLLHRRRGRRARVPRLPDRGAVRAVLVPRGRLSPDLRRAAHPGAAGRVDLRDHPPHLRPREHQEVRRGLPLRRAPDGDAARDRPARSPPSIRTPRRSTTRSSATWPPCG